MSRQVDLAHFAAQTELEESIEMMQQRAQDALEEMEAGQ